MHNSLLISFLNAPRSVKRLISVVYDTVAIILSFYLAFALRLGKLSIPFDGNLAACLVFTIIISIIVFIRMGLYRAILRYMTQQAMMTIVLGIMISSAAMAMSGFFLHAFLPRSVPIIYIFTTLILIGLPRLAFRNIVRMLTPKGNIKVIIYGAGESGNHLVTQLQLSSEFNPVAFVDDNKRLQGSVLNGITVYHPHKLPSLIEEYGVTRILLALGNISRQERIRIIRSLEPLLVQVQTIPLITDIVRGVARINELRNIQIEDLLGRDPVAPDIKLMEKNSRHKVIMITGAGGSIGSELCKQLIMQEPETMILFEQNEFNLYRIEKELRSLAEQKLKKVQIVPILGSIENKSLLGTIMLRFRVFIVYHAAAYKHVPIVEHNMLEGFKNNVLGTKNTAEAAQNAGVKHFVLISTDKAVRPTNIMGATKRLAEMLVQNMAEKYPDTIFSIVRFGNVLDSSGSVVPRFREQIKNGGPITVTHKEIVRYFMTIGEAAQLVIQAGALAQGGDVFVLEMGDPVKIYDLAREMALLSGVSIRDDKNPNGDIEIVITGLRPGEKLYEELLCDENCEGTEHPRIMVAKEKKISGDDLDKIIQKGQAFCNEFDYENLYKLLKSADINFQPKYEISDHLYLTQKIS